MAIKLRLQGRVVVSIAFVIITLIGLTAVFYFRGKIFETCDSVLKRFSGKHLCIATYAGNMVFLLYEDAAPKTVNKISILANDEKFYDGLEFYRVVKDFVIQAGVQGYYTRVSSFELSDEKMKKKIDLYLNDRIDVEVNFDKLDLTEDQKVQLSSLGIRTNPNLNTRPFSFGSIALANRGDSDPNSNTTEFFIVSSKDPSSEQIKNLNGKFTNFGEIVEGKEVLEYINNLAQEPKALSSQSDARPKREVRIIELRTN